MSTLLKSLQSSVLSSLKEGNTVKTGTLRFLLSAIRNHGIQKYGPAAEEALTDDDVLDVVRKQVKSHKESIEAFRSANRLELAKREEEELAVLASYLPPDLGEEDVIGIIKEEYAAKPDEFGPLMGRVMKRTQGKADGSMVAALVRRFLTEKA